MKSVSILRLIVSSCMAESDLFKFTCITLIDFSLFSSSGRSGMSGRSGTSGWSGWVGQVRWVGHIRRVGQVRCIAPCLSVENCGSTLRNKICLSDGLVLL